jgi:hypothetical protein
VTAVCKDIIWVKVVDNVNSMTMYGFTGKIIASQVEIPRWQDRWNPKFISWGKCIVLPPSSYVFESICHGTRVADKFEIEAVSEISTAWRICGLKHSQARAVVNLTMIVLHAILDTCYSGICSLSLAFWASASCLWTLSLVFQNLYSACN